MAWPTASQLLPEVWRRSTILIKELSYPCLPVQGIFKNETQHGGIVLIPSHAHMADSN
jgi:hypothetical protein